MVDERLIQLLSSKDAAQRKKAVMALAKTQDRSALTYLAKVYKQDSDPEIRELAKKAGAYIQKNAPKEPVVAAYDDSDDDDYDDDVDDAYDDDSADDDYDNGDGSDDDGYDDDYDEDPSDDPLSDVESLREKPAPLPSEIHVTATDISRAQRYINQAMEWNVRGNNEKALDQIRKALRLNPKLIYDGYTVSMAGGLMGIDGDEAIRRLAPDAKELSKRTAGARDAMRATSFQSLMALGVIIASGVALVAYLIMPWMDFSPIPTVTDTGEITTVGESLDATKAQFDSLVENLPSGAGGDELGDFANAVKKLKVDFNGLDVTLVSIGARDILDVMGFTALFDSLLGDLGGGEFEIVEDDYTPAPLDFTLPLIPVAAIVAFALSVTLIRYTSLSRWGLLILFGLIGLEPIIYFYLDTINDILPDDFDPEAFGQVTNIPPPLDLIAVGFWLALGAMIAIVIFPFLALLFAPSAAKEA
jgi:hypothetical protein